MELEDVKKVHDFLFLNFIKKELEFIILNDKTGYINFFFGVFKNNYHSITGKTLPKKESYKKDVYYTFLVNRKICSNMEIMDVNKGNHFIYSEFDIDYKGFLKRDEFISAISHQVNDKHIASQSNTVDFEKKKNLIKWNSSPSHFGFIISELINKGYFENLPIHNGEVNYSEIARLFSSVIDFNSSEQILLKSFNPNNEKISETVKNKFSIPNCEN